MANSYVSQDSILESIGLGIYDTRKGIIEGIKDIVKHPLDFLEGIGKAINRLCVNSYKVNASEL